LKLKFWVLKRNGSRVRNRNETGNINCQVVFFKFPTLFHMKQSWKFEKDNLAIFPTFFLEKRVVTTIHE